MKTLDGVKIIGLTGQSGAGKTTASKLFESCGIPVIDCDVIARRVADISEFLSEVDALFDGCVTDGSLNRQKLAGIVFNDQEKMRLYSSVIFPYIAAEVFSYIRKLKEFGSRLIILDAPTLFESGIDEICTAVVSVIAPF